MNIIYFIDENGKHNELPVLDTLEATIGVAGELQSNGCTVKLIRQFATEVTA